jgi:L-lactate dehydrogenase (cytochrome)
VTIGAGKAGLLQVLSHVASKSLEEVLVARQDGQEVAWQLYVNMDR